MSAILHLTTFLQGGAGRVITALASGQQRAGHEVTVVTSRAEVPGYGNYHAYLDQLCRCGVSVHLADSLFSRDYPQNLNVVRLLGALYSRAAEPDVIHAHAAIPSLIGLLFAGSRRASFPIVQTMHGWGIVKSAAQASTDVNLMNLVDRVVVPSRHAADQLATLGVSPARILRVPYGVPQMACDDEACDRPGACCSGDTGCGPVSGHGDVAADALAARMDLARRQDVFVIACVGTFGERKNQTLLVDAIARLEGSRRVLAVFLGDGDAAPLERRVRELGLAGVCAVHGYTAAARRLVGRADAVILPSRSEGQPVTVLEAFADGTVVAVSDIPELAELVEDDVTGVLFKTDDSRSLAAAIARMIAMPATQRRRLRAEARAAYLSEFSEDAMMRRYFEAYRAARDDRRAAAGVV
ncbi:MAG: glycosyltransferase family 4 protein [Acidobacteriota bacterium]